jgi:FkbM family methyltransferase
MKLKTRIYRFFLACYLAAPLKIQTSKILKCLSFFQNKKYYPDFTFQGIFAVRIKSQGKSFQLYNWKSSLETSIHWTGLEEGDWEPETVNIWIKLCKKANVIFDIGANTGIYSLIAKTINPNINVVAFEPSDLIIPKFKANMRLNNYEVSLVEKGVSNIDGTKVFYDVEGTHQTSASLDPEKLKNFEHFVGTIREYNVQTIRLDKFIHDSGLYPDVIKIDVELHEAEVLEGMGQYLINCKAVIIIEVLTDDVVLKLNKILKKSQFDYYALERDKVELVDQLTPRKNVYNYLLLPKGKNLLDVL